MAADNWLPPVIFDQNQLPAAVFGPKWLMTTRSADVPCIVLVINCWLSDSTDLGKENLIRDCPVCQALFSLFLVIVEYTELQ